MDVQISQTYLQVSFGQLDHTAAYYFWAEHSEHVQYCLIWEDTVARGLAKFKMCKNITVSSKWLFIEFLFFVYRETWSLYTVQKFI